MPKQFTCTESIFGNRQMRVSLLKSAGIGLERVVRMIFTPTSILENLTILGKPCLREMMAGYITREMQAKLG